ncbi:hypothetical protein Q8A72_18755, partial [Aeribacillus pallidus]|nr:hypothetical protein [Aeribacillus pallidus]
MFAGKKSAQIREILISESAWEEMTCLFAPSLANLKLNLLSLNNSNEHPFILREDGDDIVASWNIVDAEWID